MTLYDLLKIDKNASFDEIKKAYRKAARENHPDVNPGDASAAKKFREINDAYEVLKDPQKKAKYDSSLFNFKAKAKQETSNWETQFAENFADSFFGGSNFKGRSITTRVAIDLVDVLKGCERQIAIKVREKCLSCKGSGASSHKECPQCQGKGHTPVNDSAFTLLTTCRFCEGQGRIIERKCTDCLGKGFQPEVVEKTLNVKIPAGIMNGMQIRLPGQGEESSRGSTRGDIIVFVLINDHPFLVRDNSDLLLDIPISYSQMVLGSEIDVPTLEDGLTKLKIPEGTQPNTKFRIKQKGLPDGKKGLGDLIVTLKIESPKTISDDYKKLLLQLAQIEMENITPKRKHWQEKIKTHYK